MSKITSLMTSLHEGHKAEERLMCIDNMLFKKCEDTKHTILQAFWWYRKHSISLDKVKQAREEISDWDVNKVMDGCSEPFRLGVAKGLDIASVILDKLIESEGKE